MFPTSKTTYLTEMKKIFQPCSALLAATACCTARLADRNALGYATPRYNYFFKN